MNSEHNKIIDFLAVHSLFSDLSREDIAHLLQFTEVKYQVPEDEIIFKEGEISDSFLIVINGTLEVVKMGDDGNEYQLTYVNAGKSVGEMALLDPAPRSATVRTVTSSDLLIFDLEKCNINSISKHNPQTQIRLNLAQEISQRLRHTNEVTVTALEKTLEESRSHEELSRFITVVLIATCGYIFSLGILNNATQYLDGNTRLLSTGVMLVFVIAIGIIIKKSQMPLSTFGITTKNWRRAVKESLIFSAAAIPVIVLIKYIILQSTPGLEDKPVFEFLYYMSYDMPYKGFMLFLMISLYSLFIPIQELIFRGGLQTSLQVFLTGKYRIFFAILLSNLMFSAGHIYVNMTLALAVFPVGFLWGWLYYRHGTLIGVSLSHILLGNFLLIVLGVSAFF